MKIWRNRLVLLLGILAITGTVYILRGGTDVLFTGPADRLEESGFADVVHFGHVKSHSSDDMVVHVAAIIYPGDDQETNNKMFLDWIYATIVEACQIEGDWRWIELDFLSDDSILEFKIFLYRHNAQGDWSICELQMDGQLTEEGMIRLGASGQAAAEEPMLGFGPHYAYREYGFNHPYQER